MMLSGLNLPPRNATNDNLMKWYILDNALKITKGLRRDGQVTHNLQVQRFRHILNLIFLHSLAFASFKSQA
jgi:hypothetical protein